MEYQENTEFPEHEAYKVQKAIEAMNREITGICEIYDYLNSGKPISIKPVELYPDKDLRILMNGKEINQVTDILRNCLKRVASEHQENYDRFNKILKKLSQDSNTAE